MSRAATLVIDNWLLQEVGATLQNGLTDDHRVEVVASETSGYEAHPVPSAGIQVEELLQFLNAIVLSDELIVEASATQTWGNADHHFASLLDAKILTARQFSEARSEWLPIRKCVEELLCFSPQLSDDFTKYRANWKPGINHPIFSTLMWGTAGMIARSQHLGVPYLSHPSRSRLIALGNLSPHRQNAQEIVQRFITTERIKLFDRITAGQKTRAVTLNLPSLALEVIAESKDREQLIPTALQLREKYRHLREWIGEYQQALDAKPEDAAKRMAILEAAASDVERLFTGSWWTKLSINLGMSLTDLIPALPIGAIIQRNRPGSIRSAVSKIIKRPCDEPLLGKLFTLLDCDSPKLRAQTTKHLLG
jgi:hypothetical protein